MHREVETVFVPLRGVGEIACIRAVGDDEQLQVFEQRILTVEALLAVAVDLVEGFADRHPALFQLHLHQRQAIDEDGHIVAIRMAACLLELADDLAGVPQHVLFIEQVDVLDMPIVKNEIVDVLISDLAGLFQNVVARAIKIGFHEAQPLGSGEQDVVERLQLDAHIREIREVIDQLPLQSILALVGLT